MKKFAYKIASAITYYTMREVMRASCWLLWKPEIFGKENIPRSGGVLLAPTHRSYVDSFMAALITNRRVRALGKAELFEGRFGWFHKLMGAYPVKRGEADRGAMRQVGEWLDEGKVVLVFPEGTRKEGREVHELKDGVAYLAAKYGGTIVPVGMAGTEEAMPRNSNFKKGKVVVEIGDPIVVEKSDHARQETKEITAQIRDDLQRLFSEAYKKRDDS